MGVMGERQAVCRRMTARRPVLNALGADLAAK